MAKSYISSGATFNSEELITGLDQLQPWVEQIIRKSIKCALKNWNNPYREQKFTERHEVRPHFHYSTSVSRYRHSTNEPYPYHYLADVVIGVDMEPDEANLRSMLEILKTQTLNIELNLFTRAGEYLIFRSVEDSQKKITRIEPYTFLGQARVTDSGIEIIRESVQPSSSMAADETPDSHVSDYEAFLAGQLLECIPIGQKTIPAPIREKIAEIIQGHEPVISGFDANTQIALQVIFKFCNVGDAMLFNKEQTTPEEQSAILARVKAIVANLLKYNEEELT
ncbi:hypothetical protein BN59_02086 [Legionella massiliensis]|uniref:Uncharacterized protein n=1 Tax=Legionella massiliensis TaxID=1034943 RepID=A0A078KXV4_9GAMM|nr:hypothetical protein [Legionella massiliensis]CDZ77796.1 hypothetical protein BN59_02086 [Legionella massiliensis]CEE13534.1 hypothetical protein BN1094_02086 [Legionella massiliensis]